MNQILTTKPVKPRKNVNIKTVIIFFGISLIIFGICLVSSGSYAIFINKSSHTNTKNNTTPNSTSENTRSQTMQIRLSVDGANIKAAITGETEISFATYKWDDEEETRKDVNETSTEFLIEIPEGEHTLTITAVDINNNTETKVQKVEGIRGTAESNETTQTQTAKPKLNVTHDKEHSEFVIDASDEKGLDKFEFILNGQGYLVRVEGQKEKQFRYPLIAGDNTLEVTAYNTDGATETFKALIRN